MGKLKKFSRREKSFHHIKQFSRRRSECGVEPFQEEEVASLQDHQR